MSATILAKSGVTLYFGIDSGVAAISGYIVSDADWDNDSKKADAMDSNGATVAVAFYDQVIDLRVQALLLSGTSLPLPGSTITLTGSALPGAVKFAIMKSSGKEKNNGFTLATLDLKRWVDNSIPV